jgi:hypothetical protein
MSYRLTDPNPVWVGLLGTASAADGTLQFYDQGTTTPKATYSDEELTTPNANPVELDAAGRAETEIWLDGPYTVVLKDEDGTTVWTRDVVPEVSPTTTLPDPTTLPGGTVKSNGTGYELVDDLDLPDPTDSAGKMVVVNSDGTDYTLQDQPTAPEIPDPEIVINDLAPYSVRIGVSDDTTKVLRQYGSGTVPAAASRTSSVTVTPTTSFDKVFAVIITPRTAAVGSFGIGATFSTSGYTLGTPMSSFTVEINSADDGGDSGYTIENAWNFDWCVEGTVTVS